VRPPTRRARLAGQAANFARFLAGDPSDILHVHHAELRQFLCQRVVGTLLPLVATAHSATVLVRPHPDWLVALVKANYRRADWLIPVSNYVAHVIVQHGADPARMTVIPNGVDVGVFRPRERAGVRAELGLPQDDLIVLFTGNLIRPKGGDVLLKAAARCAAMHPELRLILIGTGPERDALLRLAGELGIADRLILAGYRPLTEMPLWYQACDLFVLPSWAEGLSVSLLEAMSCGRPVVTTFPDVGDHDAVRDGETGLLTPVGDVDQLASALDQLASSSALRTRLGDAARRLVEREFSWDSVGQKTVDVYRAVLGRQRSRP
jgi:glycosyltransferase involved in cell wall biosynthesis